MSADTAYPVVTPAQIFNVPGFSVTKGGVAQTVGAGTTLITWPTEEYDVLGNFAANLFTATVAGKYLFNASLLFSNGLGDLQLFLRKNGADLSMLDNKLNTIQVGGSRIISMAVGDTMGTVIFHNSGGDINGNVIYTGFQGAWLGQ